MRADDIHVAAPTWHRCPIGLSLERVVVEQSEKLRPFASVLFDEAHNEAWSIRPDVVEVMNPRNPGDAGYLRAAQALREHGMRVDPHAAGLLTAETLRDRDVLVLAHPSDGTWERVTGTGSPKLAAEELDAIEQFVRAGGGLVVMAECEQDKYGNNLVDLLERFGVRPLNVTVQDTVHNHQGVAAWVRAEFPRRRRPVDILARVDDACFYRSGVLRVDAEARVLDAFGRPVQGLLAAGADAGNAYGGGYAGGLAFAAVFGLKAARHVIGQ